MTTYARIIDGTVVEVFEPLVLDGVAVPMKERFHPDFVAALVEYDPANPPKAPVPPQPSVADRIKRLDAGIEAHLDAQAIAMGYKNMERAVGYADEPAVPKFQAEGRALRAWRSLVWAACYELLGQWQDGKLQEPTLEQLIAVLPVFKPPAQQQ